MGASESRHKAGSSSQHVASGSHSNANSRSPALQRINTFSFQQKYGFIPDNFTTIGQVQEKLREVGLESSNLIVGIDFTKSNEWTGRRSFGGRCLHAVGGERNPYERAITIIGETLSPFDEDNLIPCFGFGDVTTHDAAVFSFYPEGRPCHGFGDALARYRAIVPHIKLSGPTSFAPIIEAAVRTVELNGGQFHVLLIIADGQVTRSEDLPLHELSPQERATVEAIGAASNYPLSIVLVGVGDGPWSTVQAFDDVLPRRNFDNFQFVNLTRIMTTAGGTVAQRAAKFALMALMEVPYQYKACLELHLVGQRVGRMPPTAPLPPPQSVLEADARRAAAKAAAAAAATAAPVAAASAGAPAAAYAVTGGSGTAALPDANECPICLHSARNTALQCGHQTCDSCANRLAECPVCRMPISMRIRLYG